LGCGKWTVRWLTWNMRSGDRTRGKGIVVLPRLWVLSKEMVHEPVVISDIPVDAMTCQIIHWLIGWGREALHSTRAILKHTKDKDVPGTSFTLTTDLQVMRIPSMGPLLCILVHRVEK